MTDTQKRRPSDEGFTLVELLVVVLLLTVVGTIVLNAVVTGMRTAQQGQERAHALTELQRAAEEIAREVRVADSDGPDDPFIAFGDSDVLVDVRRDMDGDGTSETVRHRFVVDAGALRHCQQVYTPPGTPCTGTPGGRTLTTDLVVDPTRPVFSLVDEDGATTTSTTDASAVRILLVRTLRDGSDAQVATSVMLRNQ